MTENVVKKSKITPSLPADINQIGVVTKYDILKHLRSRRLVGLLAIEALVLVLITALPPLLGGAYSSDADAFVSSYTQFTTTLVVIGATLFAGDAIVSEFQGRTGFLLFPNPIKRSVLLAGKFIASVCAMLLVLVSYYAVALLLGVGITGGFSSLGVESMLLAMLYAVAALSVGYLVSSIMKGSTGALILTFALFLFIFSIVSALLSTSGVDPWFLINQAGGVISSIMGMGSTSIGGGGPGGSAIQSYTPDVGVSIGVMIAYAAISLVLAYIIFKRREMSA